MYLPSDKMCKPLALIQKFALAGIAVVRNAKECSGVLCYQAMVKCINLYVIQF